MLGVHHFAISQDIQKQIATLKLKGFQGQYTKGWFARTYLLAIMRAAGIQALDHSGLSVADLASLSPDQKRWVLRLARTNTARLNVGELFRAVKYQGSPELFSMWCCLCAAAPPATVASCEQELANVCTRFQAEHGWMPHPAQLVAHVAK